jgi:hypothetical protein
MLNFSDVKWIPVNSHTGYEVSSTGKVRSIERQVMNSDTTTRTVKSKTKDFMFRSGYAYVQLYQNDERTVYAVHRLVAETFITNPDNKPMVNHLDGNKLNNNVCNLEWVTCAENHQHAWATGLKDKEKHRDRMIGTKFKSTSKYHNVTFDASRSNWKAAMKVNGRMVLQKRFNTEIEAALCINDFIITNGLNRPLNIIE